MIDSNVLQLNLDPLLVTFWVGAFVGTRARSAPAIPDLIPEGWLVTELSSNPGDPRERGRDWAVARRDDGSALVIERRRTRYRVTVAAAVFPASPQVGASLEPWLAERGLTSWRMLHSELPPADPQFTEEIQDALRSRSARYFHVHTTPETLCRVLRHWAESQSGVLLSEWSETPGGAVLRAALVAECPLLADEASSSPLLIVPALRASVSYPDVRVFVATDWAPLLVCRLLPLDATSVELLLSTEYQELSQRLVAYLEARFCLKHLPTPWDTCVGDVYSDDSPAPEGLSPLERMRVEELLDRFRTLPADVRAMLLEHYERLSSLPENTRVRVTALALLAYAVDLLAAMVEDPWFGVFSVALDHAYQTAYGILRDHAGCVPGLEAVVAGLPTNLADWSELHEAGLTDDQLRRIQSQVAALAARLGRDGVPSILVVNERTLVLGHLLGYEQVLTDYRRAAAERIREARHRLRLPEAVSTDDTSTPAPDIPDSRPVQEADGAETMSNTDLGVAQALGNADTPTDPAVTAVLERLRGAKRSVAALAVQGLPARAIYDELQGTVPLETIRIYLWEFRTKERYKALRPYLCPPDEAYSAWGRQAHS